MKKVLLLAVALGSVSLFHTAARADAVTAVDRDVYGDQIVTTTQPFMPIPGQTPPTVLQPVDSSRPVASYLSQEVYGTASVGADKVRQYDASWDWYYEGGKTFKYSNGSFSSQGYESNRQLIPDTAYTIYGNPSAYVPMQR